MGVLDDAQRGPGAVDYLANPAYMGSHPQQFKKGSAQAEQANINVNVIGSNNNVEINTAERETLEKLNSEAKHSLDQASQTVHAQAASQEHSQGRDLQLSEDAIKGQQHAMAERGRENALYEAKGDIDHFEKLNAQAKESLHQAASETRERENSQAQDKGMEQER